MEAIHVSVIVPVYNASQTLHRCLGNLMNQSLKEIEVILVDDGSCDDSLSILKDCEKEYPMKAKVIVSKKNSGAGGARNLGIQHARGTYIGFCDSDDLCDLSMFEKLYLATENEKYQVVDCGFYKEETDEAIVFASDELCGDLDEKKRSSLMVSGGYVFTKLFKRSFLEQNNISFRGNCTLEDLDFLLKVFAKASNLTNVKEVLYLYKNNERSLSKINGENYYRNAVKAMETVAQLLQTDDDFSPFQEALEYVILQIYTYTVLLCLQEKENKSFDFSGKILALVEMKKKRIKLGYGNKYVLQKIDQESLRIIKMVDTLK